MSDAAAATNVRPRRYQDPLETWGSKFGRKISENPWVPIGCLLTCGALVMSAYKLRQGKSKEMNHWLRARVALQGITVVALLAGSMQLQKANSEAVQLRSEAAEAERMREKMEFEKRLLEAERATQEEDKYRKARIPSSAVVDDKKGSSWWPWSRSKDKS